MTYWIIQLTLWRKDGENMVKVPLYYAGNEYDLKPLFTPVRGGASLFRDVGHQRAIKFATTLAKYIPNAEIEVVDNTE